MAHMALYRKWRPLTFEDVVEQRHIVTTLKNSIKNNTISHAYLFCGTRGTGKTTLAKIFSRAVNCLEPRDGSPCNQCSVCTGILDGSIIDVIEIDAASNNGVDDVREIKEAVMYVPAVTRYKVYIIDEVHMLSTGAFNALLKTLEEPPENVVFILATTEPHKLPATILSRCQRFDFKRITLPGLVSRLRVIAEDSGVQVEDSALQLIARLAAGGMRDAISLLDQCVSRGSSPVTRNDVVEVSGLTATETVDWFAEAIIEGDVQRALQAIKTAMDQGKDLQPLCSQLIDWFRNLMLIKTGGEALSLIDLGEEEQKPLIEMKEKISLDRTLSVIRELSETEARLKWAENPRILFEVAAVKLCTQSGGNTGGVSDDRLASLESRIGALERRLSELSTGAGVPRTVPNKAPSGVSQPTPKKQEPVKEKSEDSQSGILDKQLLVQWPQVVDYVRSTGKMKVYAYLMDTQCILAEDGVANVVVSSEDGLKKTVLSRNESLEVLREALSHVLGGEYKVKIVDEKSMTSAPQGSDPELEKIKAFAEANHIPLDIKE
jgi:DNA polymerase-3 subunit gamma/tau